MRHSPNSRVSRLVGLVIATLLLSGSALAQETTPRHRDLDFWPKRLSPDATGLLYVQLSRVERNPVARLECGQAAYELGPATWSHNLGFVHAFDLEFTAPRTRASCAVRVTGREGREYLGHRSLKLRPKAPRYRVSSLFPDAATEGQSTTVEIRGQGFGDVVDVTWISTSAYDRFRHSARPQVAGKGQSVVLPLPLSAYSAPAGEYLVVVEDENHLGAVYADHFVVEALDDPEIVRSSLTQREGKTWVLVEGFGLSGLVDVQLDLPVGELPLTYESVEGQALETVRVLLPPHSITNLAYGPEVILDDNRLTLRLVPGGRLTGGDTAIPPSRD